MKLLCNEEESFCSKRQLLNFNITLLLAKLDTVGSRLIWNGLIFADDIQLVDIQADIFLYLFNVNELGTGA